MKLGILVVYLVAEEDERLLDIHLSQIEKTTSVPFRIYAAANRLLPRFREKIERLPYVRVCQIPATPSRGSSEHAYYLDGLVQAAVADGSAYICTFHLDSFPTCAGWAEKIIAKLRGDCVLAGAERDETDRKPVTEFMIFTREFYVAHRPTFGLTDDEMASAEYQRYLASCPHTVDSGMGYGFKLWSHGLSWFPLKRVDHNRGLYLSGALYENLIFHLGGAVRYRHAGVDTTSSVFRVARLLNLFREFGKAGVLLSLWRRLNRVPVIERGAVVRWATPLNARVFLETRNALLADPEQFLERLRNSASPLGRIDDA